MGLVLVDNTGNIVLLNTLGQNYLKAILGHSVREGDKLELPPPLMELCHKIVMSYSVMDTEYVAGERIFSFRCCLLEDGWGQIIIDDITQRKKEDERLFFTSKLASIGEITSGIAHEIFNPLQIIMGYTQLLLSQPDVKSEIAEKLVKIDDAAKRIVDIVQRLRSLARRTRKMVLELEDPIEVIGEALGIVERQYKLDNVEIIFEHPSSLDKCRINTGAIQQIVLNLVQNSHDAIVDFRKEGKVWIRLKSEDSWLKLEVEDNGPGIPKEIEGRVFEPFFSTKEKGSGLGLAIVKRLVDEMGGEVNMDNRPGEGVKFIISIPVQRNVVGQEIVTSL